jgi:peptide subunit release factor 1 (eRF1)
MVLAGVDYLSSMYREVTTYPNVLRDGVPGNPDRENPKELHQQAAQIVRPIFEESQKKAFEKYEQLDGQKNGLATSDLPTAVKAAKFGQVETLFVPLGIQRWGRYDGHNNLVILESGPNPENEDLLDLAAAETILNSGQVFAVPREQLPGKGDLAAILRYAVPIP